MKKILILFLFITTLQVLLKAQNYFVTEIPPNFPFDIIQNTEKNFVCITASEYNSYIYEISQDGVILKQRELSLIDTNLCAFSILQQANNNYLVFAAISKQNENNYKLALFELDKNLNISKIKRLLLPMVYENIIPTTFSMKQANDSELVCFGMCYTGNYQHINFIYKISTQGDSIQFKSITKCAIYDLEIRNNKIYYYESYKCDEITILNYNDLSEDTTISIPNIDENFCGVPLGSIEFLNDTSFVLFGKHIDYINNNYHAILLVDTNYHLIKSIKNIGFHNFNPQAFQQRAMAVNKSNEIIVCTHSGGYIGITKLDSQLNKIWEYLYPSFFGFVGLTMNATDDGGCIMVGITPNSVLIIKCDKNGNITSIDGKKTHISPQNTIVYPNPASDLVYIVINQDYQNLVIEFFDKNGKIFQKHNIEKGLNKIHLINVENGTYFYKIISNNKIIDKGKIVIQK